MRLPAGGVWDISGSSTNLSSINFDGYGFVDFYHASHICSTSDFCIDISRIFFMYINLQTDKKSGATDEIFTEHRNRQNVSIFYIIIILL